MRTRSCGAWLKESLVVRLYEGDEKGGKVMVVLFVHLKKKIFRRERHVVSRE